VPFTYHVSAEDRVVYLTAEAEVPYAQLEHAVLSTLSDPSYRPGFNFLLDWRRASDAPDPSYVRRLLELLAECPGEVGACRWAVVSDSNDTYAMLLMLCLIAQQRGLRADIFTNYDEARRWLLKGAIAPVNGCV
jgi:hypothetical protein